MNMKKRRLVFILVIIAVMSILIISFLSQKESYKKLTKCRITSIVYSDIWEEVQVTGQIEMEAETFLAPGIDGFIEKIYVKEGDSIKKGQALLKIKNSDSLISIYKDFVTTKASLKTAKEKFTSYETLYNNRAVSKIEFDNSKNDYESMLFSFNAINERISLLKLKGVRFPEKITLNIKSDTIIEAPVDGTIMLINYKVREFLSLTNPIMKIVNLDTPIAVLNCDEIDVNQVQVGQKVIIKSEALGERELDGTVYQVGSLAVIRDNLSTIEVKVKIANPENIKLRPGLTCDGKVIVKENKDVFTVPLESIYEEVNKMITQKSVVVKENIKREHKRFVFVIKPLVPEKKYKEYFVGVLKKKIVETGISNDRYIEITTGLEEKDMVVVFSEKVVVSGEKVLYLLENKEEENLNGHD